MIPHNKPTIEKDDIKAVTDTLSSRWVTPGKRVREFESELAKYLSNDGYAVAVESGTSALHLALLSLGIKKGDEVILPTYVCTAVLNAVNYTDATPMLVDINPHDFNISNKCAAKKMTAKTKAIVIPHIYGVPAEIDKFLELGVPIIEDCAQSLGARFGIQKVGTFGDISICSFYASKLLTTAKGGAIYSKNREHIDFIHDLVDYDYRPTYKQRYNYRMSDFQAALGLSQLKKLDHFIRRRKEIAEEYNQAVKGNALVLKISDGKENVWYRYVIISDKNPERIQKEFLKEAIEVINPLQNWELLHNYLHLNKNDFPNAENITRKTISVPIYPSLTNGEVEKVEKAICSIYS